MPGVPQGPAAPRGATPREVAGRRRRTERCHTVADGIPAGSADDPGPAVQLPPGLTPVRLVERINRFVVAAYEPSRQSTLRLHLPNSGRMQELLIPGAIALADLTSAAVGAKTAGTLLLVRNGNRWVGLDARLPNRLLAVGLRHGVLTPLRPYTHWQAEVPVEGRRVDYLLSGPTGTCLVEVKSCNRVDGDTAHFPDAPTSRGTAHLQLLARLASHGQRAAVVWFVQRSDARRLQPFAAADPAFAAAAREAAQRGVEFYAYRCRTSPRAVRIAEAIPVVL